MNNYFFFDTRFFSLEDRVAIALIMLNSGEPPGTIGTFIGANESTVSLVTKSFVDAMLERVEDYLCLPNSNKMEKIKYNFHKIHGLPNCCGVVHTTHITFGSQNNDYLGNDGLLMHAVVDTDMRFIFVLLESTNKMTKVSQLHETLLFKECEKGAWLNGSKLNISDVCQVGEYIIGDTGFPLLPWLLTPYQEENLSDCQVEFNRRHSEATTVVPKALTKLKDTWKFPHGGAWHSENQSGLRWAVFVCCILHNIVMDMECVEGMGSYQKVNCSQHVRKLAQEDAVMARDVLSQHCTTSASISGGTLTIFEDAQRLESVLKMPRRTFDYVCNLLKGSSLELMNSYFFFDMRFFSLEDRVAIALIMLNSGDPPATMGSFIGVNESTVSLVTKSFVDAMLERAEDHLCWPHSNKIEKIKYNFDKIHGLPNCCGVIHTTHIRFGSQNYDHLGNDGLLMHAVVDTDMRHSEATTIVPKAVARLKDTWKFLNGGAWRPENRTELRWAVFVCCMLHNIVTEMECDEGTGSSQMVNAANNSGN